MQLTLQTQANQRAATQLPGTSFSTLKLASRLRTSLVSAATAGVVFLVIATLTPANAQNRTSDSHLLSGKLAADKLAGTITAVINGKQIYLPSLKSDISADIQGDLATVTIRQTFNNPYNVPMNAKYLFPMNKEGAVYEMTMDVGSERVKAKIQEKKQARKTFEKAKSEGRAAALLEQQRPNMFTQKIANLMPGLPISVTMRYVHAVPRIDDAYELVLPLVVGPRFIPPHLLAADGDIYGSEHDEETAEGSDENSNNQQWRVQPKPSYPPVVGLDLPTTIEANRVSIGVEINGGMPVAEVVSRTHRIQTDQYSPNVASILLEEGRTIDNKDFVLRYKLAGESTQAGLMSHVDDRGGFFSLLIEPPTLLNEGDITPREMVFVLDCSGSMHGRPMDTSKAFMREALTNLRPSDSFRIIRFSDRTTEFSTQALPATRNNLRRGQNYAASLQGSGGTMMTEGIRQALSAPTPSGTMRIVVFLTDGYIGNETEVLRLVREQRGNARLFALGVGSSVNRYLLDEMGNAGRGFTRYLNPEDDAEKVATELAKRLESPVLTDISIDWGQLDVQDQFPRVVPDLFAGDSVRVQGRFSKTGNFPIIVNGKINGRPASLPLQLSFDGSTPRNTDSQALPIIWARSAIKDSMQALATPENFRQPPRSDAAIQQTVTDYGLDFSLVTKWTSFVAVSEQIVNANPASNKNGHVALPKVANTSAKAYPRHSGGAAPVAGPLATLLIGFGAMLPGFRKRKTNPAIPRERKPSY